MIDYDKELQERKQAYREKVIAKFNQDGRYGRVLLTIEEVEEYIAGEWIEGYAYGPDTYMFNRGYPVSTINPSHKFTGRAVAMDQEELHARLEERGWYSPQVQRIKEVLQVTGYENVYVAFYGGAENKGIVIRRRGGVHKYTYVPRAHPAYRIALLLLRAYRAYVNEAEMIALHNKPQG